MLKTSVVEPEDYLVTERDEGSGSKFDMSMMDSSIICETMDGELDQSMDSPGREASPKRSNPNVMSHPDKPRLHNDNG